MKKLLHRFPNLNRDKAGYMACATMMHMFDYPAPAKHSPWATGRWPRDEPCEGDVLGAVFDPEKLAPELLEAIQEYARAALGKGNLACSQ